MNPTSSLSVLCPLKSARIWLFPPPAPRPNSECQPADEEVGVPSEKKGEQFKSVFFAYQNVSTVIGQQRNES